MSSLKECLENIQQERPDVLIRYMDSCDYHDISYFIALDGTYSNSEPENYEYDKSGIYWISSSTRQGKHLRTQSYWLL